MKTAKRAVLHLQREINTRTYRNVYSLCGRTATTKDGMNLTAARSEVTCKFCQARMRRGF